MKLQFLSDAGHGWLKVPYHLLRDWGINRQISAYSHAGKRWVYLEEDCDAGVFLDEAKRRGVGVQVIAREPVNHSHVRRMKFYEGD